METYNETLQTLKSLITGDTHPLANLANCAAFLYNTLPDLNWAGFYLLHQGSLWLGPFQGKVACARIAPGRGVCGTALVTNKTQVVPDVLRFPGHIACDAASRSEIVVPLRAMGRPIGVLDVDSPVQGRFTPEDRVFLEQTARHLEAMRAFDHMGYDLQVELEDHHA